MSPSVGENALADRYQLLEPIGIGGMAEVHRGWDRVLRRHVAIKVFQPGFDSAAAQRFDNEVRVLAGLSHPALVSVYDADTGADTPFVVLRLIEGRTLRELMDLGPLPLDQVRRLGARLADALAYVHSHGLVHRDVKPSNILLDSDDNAYLADFGLAHLTGATRLTRTHQLVGTAAYLAPEQVLGQDIDHPADVYALGLVLLECLTGQREYQGGEVEAAVARLHRSPVVPEELPDEVRGLLARMTSSEPGDRPTADDCAQVLGGAVPVLADGTVVPDLVAPAAVDPVPVDAAPAMPATVVVPAPGPATGTTEKLPRSGHSTWKTLIASAGALVGAFAITLAATSGQPPATSGPAVTSTQQAAPEQQQGSSSDAPQDPAKPQYIRTPQDSGQAPDTAAGNNAPQVTTSAAVPAADPAANPGAADPATGTTPDPVTDPTGGDTTTEPAPTTEQPTTNPPTTAPGTTEPSPEPEDPPAQPTPSES